MMAFSYYILKVLISSAILYGYYLLVLRNKIFHSWNRFYLLAIVILSLGAPLITITVWQKSQVTAPPVINFLEVVNTGDEFVSDHSAGNGTFQIDASNISLLIYSLISLILLVFLVQTLIKIGRLKYLYPSTVIEGINFRNTDAAGTPFSFFNNIFWNNKIRLDTPAGKQIFRHEVAHIAEKHSYDKIFMNIVLIFFWCNPVFWLIRKELNIIHEFIADKKAVENSDTAALAAMILQAAYPRHLSVITNNFFYSPIKRRLQMLTKNKNPRINYLSRLMVLPLAAFVFFAFTLKAKMHTQNFYTGKIITVVVDAGHGGDDKGVSVNGISEKNITLSLAKMVKDLNTNKNINIVLTRTEDSSFGVKQRVEFARSVSADLYISIHIDGYGEKLANSGFSVLIPQNDNRYINQSKALASFLIGAFKNYPLPVDNNLKQSEKGVWILKANQYPAVLIEAGVLTAQQDLEYLTKAGNQKTIARNILEGIEKFAAHDLADRAGITSIVLDTIPVAKKTDSLSYMGNAIILANGKQISEAEMKKIDPKNIKVVSVLKGPAAIMRYGPKGKDGAIEITLKGSHEPKLQESVPNDITTITVNGKKGREEDEMKDNSVSVTIHDTVPHDNTEIVVSGRKAPPLIIVDGKETSEEEMKKINPNNIESVSVIKDDSAIKKYGGKAKNGVLEIKLKHTTRTDTLSQQPDVTILTNQ